MTVLYGAALDYVKIFSFLLASVGTYRDTLLAVNVHAIYGSQKPQAGPFYVLQGLADVSFKQAELACSNLAGDLFSVKADMDVVGLFQNLSISSAWTGIFKSTVTGTMIDVTQYPPVTRTQNGLIDMTGVNPTMFSATDGVILKVENGKLKYVTAPQSELHKAICVQKIPFTRTTKDMTALEYIKQSFLADVNTLLLLVKKYHGMTRRKIL
jgi:hypothetical protein